ncbi:NADPH-dependent FMN reductase [Streptomyces sp. SID3343]|uniref:NADPH-dependent FMN reductase n=1 Tax=Streptomyces sp. SID3343 TaxID=2690260 RepID=UPI00136B8871|nr:NADPH-dependent FMN reductase [Streptomyces sp. SID3343]MYW05535.1 NADPH-dependent FMN reductase [Streptomyces sp. SID3343]
MASVLTVWGSPSAASRTGVVARHVAARLRADGHDLSTLAVRDLPAEALLHADFADPHLRAAVAAVADADALVIASPVYKAAYSGVLKTFLDVLPQFALRGKEILPVLTGGTPAHVLALDYALRPVLTSLGADHVAQGWFVHERFVNPTGEEIEPEGAAPLNELVDSFSARLRRSTPPSASATPPLTAGAAAA